ncbi:MAG: hypothetical protein L6R42_007163 [Xanthoria sp. 1 TBL-2021]|nr:MAG: hypothetical protein L6R42_007163 [Xanthoria sp. 1 TBL-2021]
MISVLKLPDANTRQQTLNANVSVLRKSDESAYTIVPSALTPSIWSHTDDSVISEASESSLVYRELAFDDDLFTARVYKRNYRGREVRKVKQEIEDDDSPNKTPTTLAVSTTASNAPRTGVSHSSSATDVFELPGLSIPPVVTAGQWVVTGWMVRYESGRHPSHMCPYVGILGPVVTRVLFKYHCLSEWKKIDTAYPKLDCEDVIQNINWRRLFETSVDIPPQWLYHCFIAACLMGKEELIRLILQKDPDIFLTPLYFYDYRHPVELAFYQGHIHIVKMLLRLKPSAMDSLHHLGRFMIRKALREHDNELLAQVLMQDAFDNEQICDDQKHVVRLAHQNGSQTRCLGSLIEVCANFRILENPDRSAFRYLASTLPPDVVIIARLPLSVGERREIIRTIIIKEALVRCSHHGFEWHPAYDTAVQRIADYLMLQAGLIYIGELGVETYSCLINTLESHFPEIVRRPGIMASLEAMQRPQTTTSLGADLALSPPPSP